MNGNGGAPAFPCPRRRSILPPRRLRCLLAAIIAMLAVLTSAAPANAQGADFRAKLDSVLRLRARQLIGRSRVIVEFRDELDVRAITQRRGMLGRSLPGHRAQVAEVDNYSLELLAADHRVAHVSIDRPAFPLLERTGAAVGAAAAREQLGVTGRGIGVAVIDSGITGYHDDLYSLFRPFSRRVRVAHFRDFTVDPRLSWSRRARDPHGHGTHVAGIIAGSGFDSRGARMGIAPQAHLIGLKVLDDDGGGYISDVIAALDYAVVNRKLYNIRVINLSVAAGVYESYETDPLTLAAKRAVDAGIVVVTAAGNLGRDAQGNAQYRGVTSPGNAPWVITVGASSHQGTAARGDDVVAGFSSRGPTFIDFDLKPDLVAPGYGIESLADPNSALYVTHADYLLPGTVALPTMPYLSLSGTSMSAPVVSGTVALMLQANPELTPNAVKAILQYTAQLLPDAHPFAQGAGLLNAKGAVRMARFFVDPQRGLGAPRDTIAGEHVRWARHVIWANHRLVGGVPLPGSNAWTVTWGATRTPEGDPVVWGVHDNDDNIVWSVDGDENIVWSVDGDDNIVWSVDGDENIVWSVADDENIVWSVADDENIVWSVDGDENIVWSVDGDDNIVWSVDGDDNIVWSVGGDENIVWSVGGDENIVWSVDGDDNIVWSVEGNENTVWSTGTAEPILWPATSTPVFTGRDRRAAEVR